MVISPEAFVWLVLGHRAIPVVLLPLGWSEAITVLPIWPYKNVVSACWAVFREFSFNLLSITDQLGWKFSVTSHCLAYINVPKVQYTVVYPLIIEISLLGDLILNGLAFEKRLRILRGDFVQFLATHTRYKYEVCIHMLVPLQPRSKIFHIGISFKHVTFIN